MIEGLIWLVVVLAILAIVWWGVNQLSLPQPVRVVAVVLVAVVAIVLLAKFFLGVVV